MGFFIGAVHEHCKSDFTYLHSMKYISSTIKQYQYYKSLADGTIDQLEDAHLHWKYNEECNSIAMIIKHVAGNMLSRWTDFRTTDGEKSWRHRESEFADDLHDRQAILAYWEKGWQTCLASLNSVQDEELDDIIYIRNQGHTIVEAINRQLAHYAYHIGQIVHIGKMMKGIEWQSLSIPRGRSDQYNAIKMDQDKNRGHYTDEFLT